MNDDINSTDDLNPSEQSRRDFIGRAGRFALYTPPTMMMLMHPGPEAIASGRKKKHKGPKIKDKKVKIKKSKDDD